MKEGKPQEIPPPLLILNEKNERVGIVLEQRGLLMSLGNCFITLEIDEEKL